MLVYVVVRDCGRGEVILGIFANETLANEQLRIEQKSSTEPVRVFAHNLISE